MSPMKVWLVVMVFVLGCGVPAGAQERPVVLDTVRVGVNSRASPAAGSDSRAAEVIDRAAIQSLPATTVTDVLGWALGVDLMARSVALADVAIRGSSYEQVLILVDGVRFRDAQTGHFNLNLAVPLEQIERIEILRGPASSLYGSDALGGVINIITKRGGSGMSASLSHGSFATSDASLSWRHPVGSVTADVAATYLTTDGHRPGTDAEVKQLRASVSVPAGTDPFVTEVAVAERDFGATGFYGNYPSFEATRTTMASARWRVRADSAVWIDPVVHFRRGSDDFILYRDEPERYRNLHETDQLGGEVIVRMAGGPASLAAGVHGTRDVIRSGSLGDRSEWAAGASIEIATSTPSTFSGTGGLRADRLSSGDLVVSPSVSAAWSARPWLRLRSSGGQAFRAPTWTERYYRDPANIGNPDLTPEHAWTIDAGADLAGPAGIRASLTTYLRSARELIDWARPVGDDTVAYVTRNVDVAEFRGVEAEIALGSLAGFGVLLKGDWLSLSSSVADGFESKYALRPLTESVSLMIDRSVGFASAGVRFSRERRVGEPAHTLADARVAVERDGFTLRVDGRNLFDTAYQDISLYPAPGRSISVGIEWRGRQAPME